MFDLITQLSNSKPMIDAFTTVYFTPDNYQHAEQQLVESKKFYEKFFQTKIFPNTSLSGEEMDQYIQELRTMSVMKVYHFNDSSFELDPNLGVSVLKKDVFGLDPTKDLRLPLGFSKGFYSVNAKYLPRLIEGTVTVPEQLYLYPNFLLALKDYPEYTQWLIDHETGHKFNKAVDSIRGPKLWLTFNKLLECLHTSTGTTMAQDEEMLADWLAAERTAFALNSEKNRNKKRKILDGILAIQCSRQREEERYGGHDNWDEHPSASVRNEVLLGKNPIVLKVLGCPMVPHCTLEGLTTLPPAQEGTPADKGIKPAAPPAAKLLSR